MEPPGKNEQEYSFKGLLEKLQEDSWQLELLVSGFAIVLVVGAYEPLQELWLDASLLATGIERNFFFMMPVVSLQMGWLFLLVNLIAHVLFRGLWISTIGLRYVSGEVDYEELRFSPRFQRFLQKRIGSFDRYIESLENLCSVIFAFTFLIIFSFISFCIYVVLFGALANFLNGMEAVWGKTVSKILGIILLVLLSISGLIYFIDFITLGFFKRKEWAARWYMPIYRIMSWCTLSFIYRPIYYNLIDNKFGRRFGYFLVPYIIFLILVSTMHFGTHPFFPDKEAGHLEFRSGYYDDMREEKSIVFHPAIPSPYVSNGYLEVFLPYHPVEDDDRIASACPDYDSGKKTRIGSSAIQIQLDDSVNFREKADSSFQCLCAIFKLSVNDSIIQEVDFQLFEHPNRGEKGLRTTLDVDYLPRGRHTLAVEKRLAADSIAWHNLVTIPFWVE